MYEEGKDADSVRSSEIVKQSEIEIDLDESGAQDSADKKPGTFNFNDFNSEIPSYKENSQKKDQHLNVKEVKGNNQQEDDNSPAFKIANYDKFANHPNQQESGQKNEQMDQDIDKKAFFTGLDENGQKIKFGSINLKNSITNPKTPNNDTSMVELNTQNNVFQSVKLDSNMQSSLSKSTSIQNNGPVPQLEGKNQKVQMCFKTLLSIIGSILSMLTLILTILQPLRGKFYSVTMYITYVAFVLARIIICGIILIQYLVKHVVRYKGKNLSKRTNYDSDADEDQVEKKIHEQEKNQGCKLYFAIPFMFYTGSYRFLETYPFKIEIGIAFALELFISLIPPLGIITTNNDRIKQNSDLDLHISTLTYAIIACIAELILEVVIYVIIIIFERKRKFFKQVTVDEKKSEAEKEKERREQYSNRYLVISIVFLTVFFILLGIAISLIQAPSCGEGQVLQYGICQECEGEMCSACSRTDICTDCYSGYYLHSNGSCMDCDIYEYIACTKCKDRNNCEECAKGYRLDETVCIECNMMDGCAQCDEADCLGCFEEYYMNEKGICKLCKEEIDYCYECSSGTRCDKCHPKIALVNQMDGTCVCNNDLNYFQSQNGTCECKGYVNKDTRECLLCDQQIPNCLKCENVATYHENYTYVGKTSFAPNQLDYLKCAQCKEGYYFDAKQKSCVPCSNTLGQGCKMCSQYGEQCQQCSKNSTMVQENQKSICKNCDTSLSHCLECRSLTSCDVCDPCYPKLSIFDPTAQIDKKNSFDKILEGLTESERKLLDETCNMNVSSPENQKYRNQVFKQIHTEESYLDDDQTRIVKEQSFIKEEGEQRKLTSNKQIRESVFSDPLERQLYETFGVKQALNFQNNQFNSPQKNQLVKNQINNIRQIYKDNPQKYFERIQKEFIDHITPRKNNPQTYTIEQSKQKVKGLEVQDKPPRPLNQNGFQGFKVQREQLMRERMQEQNQSKQMFRQRAPHQDKLLYIPNQGLLSRQGPKKQSQKGSRRQSRDIQMDQISSLPYIQYSDQKNQRLNDSAYGQREEKIRQMKLLKVYQRGMLGTSGQDRQKGSNNESLIDSPRIKLISTQKQFHSQPKDLENQSLEQRDIARANSAIRQTILEQKKMVKEAKNSSLDAMEFQGRKDGKEIIIFTTNKKKQKATDLLIIGDDNGDFDQFQIKNGQIFRHFPQSTTSSKKNFSRNGSKSELKETIRRKKKQQSQDEQNKDMQRDDSKTRLQQVGSKHESRLQHQQNKQLDSFFKCQQLAYKGDSKLRREREIIQTFLKRNQYEDDTIVFILNSRDSYLKRAALRRGWVENTVQNSLIFDIKFEYTDKQNEYNNFRTGQFYNHFPDGREITTKQGLNKNMNNITQPEIDIYKFYPRCYDLSDLKQIDAFQEDFNKTAILSIIKSHAKLFKSIFKEQLEEIYSQDSKILDNVFKQENKKKLKRKYWTQFPSKEEQVKLGLINIVLLQNAIFFAKNILNDINENCEGDEFIKKNFYVPRYQFNQKFLDLMVLYSQLHFPIITLGENQRILQYISGWDFPNFYLMFVVLKMHRQLKKSMHQYKEIDGSRNAWICKPSYNARGFGIFCFNNMSDLMGGNIRKNPTPKIVQKYIENSFLININEQEPNDLRKFDIRQWVLVTSFDPLKIYVYQNAYLRVCGSSFDMKEINDPLKHISNYTVQKKQEGVQAQELTISIKEFIQILNKNPRYKDIKWDHFSQQIQKIVEISIKQASENIEQRNNCFELYGFDFVIDKNLNCWLIEVNMSPACAERTSWLTEMLDDMAEGMLNILEKQILVNSPPDQFYGRLAQLQEDHFQNRIKVDTKNWKFIGKPHLLEKKQKQNGSPLKNNKQQKAALINQCKQSMFMFDIVGQKLNLKQEKKLDKWYQQYQAVLFIQKFWRGFQVRNSIYQNKMKQKLKEFKLKHELNNLFEILDSAYERTTIQDILNQGFQQLRFNRIEKFIKESEESLQKILRIQRFFKKKLQERNNYIYTAIQSRNVDIEMDETGGQSIRGDQRLREMLDLKTKLSLIEEATETSQAFQSCRPIRTPVRNQRQGNYDRELLLEFSQLGIFQQQDTAILEKLMLKRSTRQSPKPSPYTQSIKHSKMKAKQNKVRQSQEQKVKNEFQINQAMMRTQRQQFGFGLNDKKTQNQKKLNQLVKGEQPSFRSPVKNKQ